MAYVPQFIISPRLLEEVEQIAALRERIQNAVVDLAWIPALQKDTRTRNVHASTAIEGNPLTLEQVRALEEGRELASSGARSKREVINYFAGLRYVEKNAAKKRIGHTEILELHRILAGEVMDQGVAGTYRMIAVRVGTYLPPPPDAVSGLMFELLEWWEKEAKNLSPVLSSAILHYRFEAILHLRTAMAAQVAHLRYGNSTAAVSTRTTSFPWMNTTGKIGRGITQNCKRFVIAGTT